MSNMSKSVNNLRAIRNIVSIVLCKLGLIICQHCRRRNCTITLSQAFGYVRMSAKSARSFMGCSDPSSCPGVGELITAFWAYPSWSKLWGKQWHVKTKAYKPPNPTA